MSKEIIVKISGKQGSGKTSIARELVTRFNLKNDWEAFELRFAGGLYQMHNQIRDTFRFYGVDAPEKDGELLQMLGLWARKKYGEDVWVKMCSGAITNLRETRIAYADDNPNYDLVNLLIVISDCRFRNEFDLYPEALRVRLECPEEIRKTRAESWRDNTDHQSETDLDAHSEAGLFDLKLKTDGSLPLAGCVELIMAKLDKGNWVDRRSRPI